MQRALFDGDVDRVALADPRGRAEAPDERGPLVRRELLDRAIVSEPASSRTSSVTAARADVLGQLADLLGDRWRAATEKCIKTSEPSASRSSA